MRFQLTQTVAVGGPVPAPMPPIGFRFRAEAKRTARALIKRREVREVQVKDRRAGKIVCLLRKEK
jgi:hypothetical protein